MHIENVEQLRSLVDEAPYDSSLVRRDRILNTITQTPTPTSLTEFRKAVTLDEGDQLKQLVNKWFADVRLRRGKTITLERRIPKLLPISETMPIIEQINQVLSKHPEGLCISELPDHITLPTTNLTGTLRAMGFKYQNVDGIPVFYPIISLPQSQASIIQKVVENGGSLPIERVQDKMGVVVNFLHSYLAVGEDGFIRVRGLSKDPGNPKAYPSKDNIAKFLKSHEYGIPRSALSTAFTNHFSHCWINSRDLSEFLRANDLLSFPHPSRPWDSIIAVQEAQLFPWKLRSLIPETLTNLKMKWKHRYGDEFSLERMQNEFSAEFILSGTSNKEAMVKSRGPPPSRSSNAPPEFYGKIQGDKNLLAQVLECLPANTNMANFQTRYSQITGEYLETRDLTSFLKKNKVGTSSEAVADDIAKLWANNLGGIPLKDFQGSFYEATGRWFWGQDVTIFGDIDSRGYLIPASTNALHRTFSRDLRAALHENPKLAEADIKELNLPFQSIDDLVFYVLRNNHLDCSVRMENGSYVIEKPDLNRTPSGTFEQRLKQIVSGGGRLGDLLWEYTPEIKQFAPTVRHLGLDFIDRRFGNYIDYDASQPNPSLSWKNQSLLEKHANVSSFLNSVASRKSILLKSIENALPINTIINTLSQEIICVKEGQDWRLSMRKIHPDAQVEFPKRYYLAQIFPLEIHSIQDTLLSTHGILINTSNLREFLRMQGFKFDGIKVLSQPPKNKVYSHFSNSEKVRANFEPYVIRGIVEKEALNVEMETDSNGDRWFSLRDCVSGHSRSEQIDIPTPILMSEVIRKAKQPFALKSTPLKEMLEKQGYQILDMDFLNGDQLVIKNIFEAMPSIMRDILEPNGSLSFKQIEEEWADRFHGTLFPPRNLPWVCANHLSTLVKVSDSQVIWRASELAPDVRTEKILASSEPMNLTSFQAKWREESGTYLDPETLTTILTRPYVCITTNPTTDERLLSSQWKNHNFSELLPEIASSIMKTSPMLSDFQDRFAELTGRYLETDNLLELLQPFSGRIRRFGVGKVQFSEPIDLQKELASTFKANATIPLQELTTKLSIQLGDDITNIVKNSLGFLDLKSYLQTLPEVSLTLKNKDWTVRYVKPPTERKSVYVTNTPLGLRIFRTDRKTIIIKNVAPRLGGENLGIEPGDQLVSINGEKVESKAVAQIIQTLMDTPLPYEVAILKRDVPEEASALIADDFWKSRLHEVRLSEIQTLHQAHTGKFLWVPNLIETLKQVEDPQLEWFPIPESFDFTIKSSDTFNQVSFASMLKGFLDAFPEGIDLSEVHMKWKEHFKLPPPFATNSEFFNSVVHSNLDKCQISQGMILPKPRKDLRSGTLESSLLRLYDQKESYQIADLVGALITHPSVHAAANPREYLFNRFHYCLVCHSRSGNDPVYMNANRKYLEHKAERLLNQPEKLIRMRENAINSIIHESEVQSTATLLNTFSNDFDFKNGNLVIRNFMEDQHWNPNLLELAVLTVLDSKPYFKPEMFQSEFVSMFHSAAPTSNLERMLSLTGKQGKLKDGKVCYRARYPYVSRQANGVKLFDLDVGMPNVSVFNILNRSCLEDLKMKISFSSDLDGGLLISSPDKNRVPEIYDALKKHFEIKRDGFSSETLSSFTWLPPLILEFQKSSSLTVAELRDRMNLSERAMNDVLRQVVRRLSGIWKIQTDEFGRVVSMELRTDRPKKLNQILDATQGREIFKLTELTDLRLGSPGVSREDLCRRFGYHSVPLIHDVMVGKDMFSLRKVQLRSFLAQYPNGFAIDDLSELWGNQFGSFLPREARIKQIVPAFERVFSSQIEKRDEPSGLAFRPRKDNALVEVIRGQKRRLPDDASPELRKRMRLSPRVEIEESGDLAVRPSDPSEIGAILTAFCRAKPMLFSFSEFQSLYISIAGEPLDVPDLLPFFKSNNFSVAFDEKRQELTAIPPRFVVRIHGLSKCGEKRDSVVNGIIERTSGMDIVKIVQESEDTMLMQLALTQDANEVRQKILPKVENMHFIKVRVLDLQEQAKALTQDLEKSILKILASDAVRLSDFQNTFKSVHGSYCYHSDLLSFLENIDCTIESEQEEFFLHRRKGAKVIVEDDRIMNQSQGIPSTVISNSKKTFSRGIEIRGVLDKKRAHEIYTQLEGLAADENKKVIIPVHIHGDQANFQIDAVMQLINIFRTSKTSILTYMSGVCDLPAVLLAANGTIGHRYLGPKTFIIFQDPKRIMSEEIELRLFESLLNSLDVYNQQTRGFLLNEIRGHTTAVGEKFWTIGPEHALDLGLFDFVEMPNVPNIMRELRGLRRPSTMTTTVN